MVKRPSTDRFAASDSARKPAKVPFDFVLDELESLSPTTKPMFGCTAVYVGDRIVMILRHKDADRHDSGVWLATTEEHHASLRAELPSMRSIAVFGGSVTGWQNLPETSDDFEDSVLRACALVRKADPRIGKVPKRKAPKKAPAAKPKARRTR